MKPSLPQIDVPKHLMEPKSCAQCASSYRDHHNVLVCSRARGLRCTWARDEEGKCGPDAKLWKQGAV